MDFFYWMLVLLSAAGVQFGVLFSLQEISVKSDDVKTIEQ